MLAAMLVSGVVIVALSSPISFLLDDWTYILYRRELSLDAFLEPANEHLVAAPVAIFKLLLETFGMGTTTLPFRLLATALFLPGAWFLFIWIRRRLGAWPALLATLPILFLGSASDDFLWFASITFLGSMTFGLGMLVALDRRDALGDRLACAGIVGSMLFSSLWLPFAIGAGVDILLRRGERDWRRRAYVVVIPVTLYAAWWLGWGHAAEGSFSLHNVATTPLFVLDSLGAAIAAFFGLATPVEGIASPGGLDWGRPLAVLLGGLAAWRLFQLDRIPRSFWVVLAIVLAFWLLSGFAVKSGRVPWASRYQYPGAALLLLVAVDLLRGVRLERRLLAPAAIVVTAAVASNGLFLHLAAESYERTSRIERADLAAVEIARDTVDPGLVLEEDIADTGYVPVDAGSYLSARDAYGSPAYSEAELVQAPAEARLPADKVLAAALGLGLTPVGAARAAERGRCRSVAVTEGAPAMLVLPPRGALLRPLRGSANLSLRRFADSFPVELGGLRETWSELAIPVDRSRRPWKANLIGAGRVVVCGRRVG
jgi:hypothetical protein